MTTTFRRKQRSALKKEAARVREAGTPALEAPAGTPVPYAAHCRKGLNAASTEDQAWANLMEDAAHMPYKDKAAFIERGYTIEKWEGWSP